MPSSEQSDCQACSRDIEQRGLCQRHLLRERLDGVAVGDEIHINGYGPFMVRRKTERANYEGNYIDTMFRLVGNREDGSIWRVKLYCNDSGRRGKGMPGWHTADDEWGRGGGANSLHSMRFDEVPDGEAILAEKTASDLIDDVR